MGHIWEGVSGDGLGETFGKRDCHRASSRNLAVSLEAAFTISSVCFFPVQHYSNEVRILVATGFTTLLVNFESMTSKQNVGWVESRGGRALFCTC